MNPIEIKAALLRDLKENGIQTSWDWESDLRFARILGEEDHAETLKMAIDSPVVIARRWAVVDSTGIPKKRLRYLRQLVNEGTVESGWMGTGEGGINELGVGRIRWYEAIDFSYKKDLKYQCPECEDKHSSPYLAISCCHQY